MNIYNISDYGVKANATEFQTELIQRVLDMCKHGGGKVVFPAGTYYISSLRIWSDTEVYLEKGVQIFGSKNCNDYAVYDLGENFEFFTDLCFFSVIYPSP